MLQKQLLIIMDDIQTSQLIRERLESAAMKADCVASLSKALEFSMKRLYCLLIIDLQISHIDNAEMVRIFRIAKRIPILAFTEALTTEEKTNLLHAGVDAGGVQHVQHDLPGQLPGGELVGGQVVGHVHQHFVD